MRRSTLLLLTATLLFLSGTGYAQLSIQSPKALKDYWSRENPKSVIANFGYVPWGRKLAGVVFVAEPFKACESLGRIHIDKDSSENAEMYPIILAERGNCTLTQKAQNAQDAGAKMIIIIDTINEDLEHTMPVGDGQEGRIHIPTIMIGPQHGAKIKQYIDLQYGDTIDPKTGAIVPREERPDTAEYEPVTVSMYFSLPTNLQSYVSIEFWLSGTDKRSFELLAGLKKSFEEIGFDKLRISIYYAIWYCPYCKEMGYTVTDNVNCYSGGRYCSPDPDDDGPLTGRDILDEDLRQLCMYQVDPSLYFDYMSNYDYNCLEKKGDAHECYESVLHKLGGDVETNKAAIKRCVDNSFEGGQDRLLDNNSLLEVQRKTFKRRGIQVWPSIVLDGSLYRGNVLPANNVYEAVCESFSVLPDSCVNYFQSKKEGIAIYHEVDQTHLKSIIGWIIAIAFVIFIVALFLYRRWVKRELMRDLNNRLNTRISDYMAMQDDESKAKA